MSNNAVCFYNDGTLDRRSFTMMGLSAKADDSAVGFFGTGFKYAIATLIRNGCNVRVYTRGHYSQSDHTVYEFITQKSKFRNKELDFIKCIVLDNDDEVERFEMPFTTHLGVNWQLWQAYRELYTNSVLDEHGGVCAGDDVDVTAHDVCVVVDDPSFYEVYEQRDKYFIHSKHKTLATTQRMRCIDKKQDSDNVVYYKSMYTGTRMDKPTLFTYDYVSKVDLTEDRTLADVWYIKQHICDIWILGMTYEMLIEWLPQAAKSNVYEYDMNSYNAPSEQFIRAVEHLVKLRKAVPIWAHDMYSKSRPFDEQVTHHKPTKHQQKMLDHALKLLAFHDCVIDGVVVCTSLPDELSGMYRNGTVYLSKQIFERGDMTLLGTLFEEWCHMYHGCDDMTRRMQNILVDKVAVLMQQVYSAENS